jgi:probable F420-dependent oxidoreductase
MRDYAQALESVGVDTLHVVDHVVYAWPALDGTRPTPYRPNMWQMEPLMTLAFLAACTEQIGLETGVLILPQRPPALVAKQVASLDVLSNGRVRLGIGVGIAPLESEAMGVPWNERGARMVESIRVMKKLWTQDHIVHSGRFYHLDDVAAEPKPIQKPHPPLIMGGNAAVVLRRVGRMANGWMAVVNSSVEHFANNVRAVKAAAKDASREDEVTIFEGSLTPKSVDPSDNLDSLRAHEAAGATDMLLWINTAQESELRTLDGKVKYVERLLKDVWPEI